VKDNFDDHLIKFFLYIRSNRSNESPVRISNLLIFTAN
jgi:hypothetical protein